MKITGPNFIFSKLGRVKSALPLILLVLLNSAFSCTTNPGLYSGKVLDKEHFFGEPWSVPGLVDEEGREYDSPAPNPVTGKTLDVTDFGARPDQPGFDNRESFQKALETAQPGDEVYIPAGEWHFSSAACFAGNYVSHIHMKSGVNLRGAGRDETVLVSRFDENDNRDNKTTHILCLKSSDLVISDLSLTSPTPDGDLPDRDVSNFNHFVGTAPVYGIVVDNNKPIESHGRVVIEDVLVEKFQRMAFRIRCVHDVRVSRCHVRKATDLGGGGAGYGVSIQGRSNGVDLTGFGMDTVHNIVEDCTIEGPFIRHGILLQYFAHHNIIRNNTISHTLLDAIDLHGEDEYGNEISGNTIVNARRGAGIGLGNSGATHDKSGPNNYIHDNIISGGARGIDVLYGSPRTIITGNRLENLEGEKATGIAILDGPETKVAWNIFENINGGTGISLAYAYNALEPEKGLPRGISLVENSFINVTRGLYTETTGEDFNCRDNTCEGEYDTTWEDGSAGFVLPEVSDTVIPKAGELLLPSDDNFITNEGRSRVQTQPNMKFKSSYYDISYNRMIYMKFDLSDAPSDFGGAYLQFTGKSKDGRAGVNIWGTESFNDWSERTITWNNSPFHEGQTAKVLDHGGELTLAAEFTFPSVGSVFNTYYVEVTDYIRSLESSRVTLILSNDNVENMYCEIYSKEISNEGQRPGLLFTR